MNLKKKFQDLLNGKIFLNADYSHSDWEIYLKSKKWISEDEKVTDAQKPGEGNMNFVQRIITNERSVIIKQSRPWVEKYPQVNAPVERVGVEAAFYQSISEDQKLTAYSPGLIGYDSKNYIMAVEDLGAGSDLTYLYQDQHDLTEKETDALIDYISLLHQHRGDGFPTNQAMKKLNHEHIFLFPYQEDNGMNLDTVLPGLQEVSLPYKNNQELKNRIKLLGDIYLAGGNVLIHGDYYPGSWLKVNGKLKIIDPEFGHRGKAEFDLGVMLAHFKLAHLDEMTIQKVLVHYKPADEFDVSLCSGFAGIEIMRRILGLAQLPLSSSLEDRKYLLEEANQLVMQPDSSYLLQMIAR